MIAIAKLHKSKVDISTIRGFMESEHNETVSIEDVPNFFIIKTPHGKQLLSILNSLGFSATEINSMYEVSKPILLRAWELMQVQFVPRMNFLTAVKSAAIGSEFICSESPFQITHPYSSQNIFEGDEQYKSRLLQNVSLRCIVEAMKTMEDVNFLELTDVLDVPFVIENNAFSVTLREYFKAQNIPDTFTDHFWNIALEQSRIKTANHSINHLIDDINSTDMGEK